MIWSPLQLRGLSFNGPDKAPALLEFQRGLNVVCGSSDTGKSFILEAIDFLLGSRNPPKDIPERIGYDRARLVLQPTDTETFTLERSTSGGNFHRFEGAWLSSEPNIQPNILRERHDGTKDNTLSTYLLSLIKLQDKNVLKNQQGETQSLSFRNLTKLVIVKESEITKDFSPILSGQNTLKTTDYSVFKLLLTGVDDSAFVAYAKVEAERATIQQNNNAKVELIDEFLEELQRELSQFGTNRVEAEDRLAQLKARSDTQQETLNQLQQELDNRVERRRELTEQLERLSSRIGEISSLLLRFELLKKHYQIDLERLAAIQESGSLFVHLERTPCPLCGVPPGEQHQDEVCDGDVESVIHAANAEIAKVEKLSQELDQTAADLRSETEQLSLQQAQVNPELQILNREIQEIISPFKDAQNTFSELIKQSGEIQRVIDKFSRVEELQEKRAMLLTKTEELRDPVKPKVDLSMSVLDDFAQTVQRILQAWNFPNSHRVHFDENTKDIVIGGQPRTSRGKGLRAITHAAMTIGLMEFCKNKNLSHPGFVVLDSPLLAYYKPESLEDSLQGSDLEIQFYDYLVNNHSESQIIIIENERPQTNFMDRISLNVFTKNPDEGRYGFFPVVE